MLPAFFVTPWRKEPKWQRTWLSGYVDMETNTRMNFALEIFDGATTLRHLYYKGCKNSFLQPTFLWLLSHPDHPQLLSLSLSLSRRAGSCAKLRETVFFSQKLTS